MSESMPPDYDPLFSQIIPIVEAARGEMQRSVNTAMVQTYWHIGRLIVEYEQGGEQRAAYGKAQLNGLSRKLTERFCVCAARSERVKPDNDIIPTTA